MLGNMHQDLHAIDSGEYRLQMLGSATLISSLEDSKQTVHTSMGQLTLRIVTLPQNSGPPLCDAYSQLS